MAQLIGIAGDSGTGKTTIAKILAKKLNATIISLDDYHKYGRTQRKEMKVSPLNPKVSDFKWIYKNLLDLKKNKEIEKPVYDHKKGIAMACIEKIKPKKTVIIEGLLPFYTRKLSQLYSLKIFVQPEMELQIEWKLKRDSKVRHYSKQFDLIERKGDFKKYVLPQKKKADVIIEQKYSKFSKRIVACDLALKKFFEPSLKFVQGKYTFNIDRQKITKIHLDGNLSEILGEKNPVRAGCSLIIKTLRIFTSSSKDY